jgi:hypothetical protein
MIDADPTAAGDEHRRALGTLAVLRTAPIRSAPQPITHDVERRVVGHLHRIGIRA